MDVEHGIEEALDAVLHEIRQPLAAVFALAEAVRGRPDLPADVRRTVDELIREAEDVSAAAGSVVEMRSRRGLAPTATVDVDEVVRSVFDSYRRTWRGTLRSRGNSAGSLEIAGGRTPLRRCLVNVVDNAVRAAGPKGTVTVAVHRGSDVVRISVEDDGPGFGRGPTANGLGLLVTRRLLDEMGGQLVTSLPSNARGAVVTLFLSARMAGPSQLVEPVRAV
ncbi:sensor histidine kinase [Blastococcus deserti]|uniref:histidine kinase n=1 Tax=Blastococcus deserti TaxID=2259033 RepID=A0ABW4XBX2_9ACTN